MSGHTASVETILCLPSMRSAPWPTSPEQLYVEYGETVWGFLRHMGIGASAIDDAVQEVFLVVHRKFSGFRFESTPKTWVLGIALRVAKDFRRKAARYQRLFDPTHDPESTTWSRAMAPDETLAARQQWQALCACLDELEQGQRRVFVLVDLQGCAVKEAAEILRVRPSTASSRLQVARRIVNAWVERMER